MKAKTLLTVLTSLILAGIQSYAQTIPQNLNNYVTLAAEHGEFNGNLLIAGQGTVLYEQSFGYRDISLHDPLTEHTLFQLASISKTFTAVAVLQLRDKGKFRLDDPFVKYIPEFPYQTITIRQLLAHTSGLPDKEAVLDSIIAKNSGKIFTNADIIPALQIYHDHKHLRFAPGESWGYSSIGYALLALLVEKVSREPFAVYIKNHILLPAGMTKSYVQTNLAQANAGNRTVNYQYNNHFERKVQKMDTLPDWREWTYNLSGILGHNNVISTTTDLLKYDQALYSGILLNETTLEEAFTPVKLNNGQNNRAIPGSSYGLGWFIMDDTSNGKIVWHSGSNPGITTLFVRNIIKKQTYIILQNVVSQERVYNDMMSIISNKPVVYKQSTAFSYGNDLYQQGSDYALAHLTELKNDTASYVLREDEMDRIGLEFGRAKLHRELSLEAYKINTLLFPNSWQVYAHYADILQRKNKEAAIMLYKKALSLNTGNAKIKKVLEELSAK